MTQKRRGNCIRAALVLLWIGLGALLFTVYRGHTLLVDNRNTDEGLRAPDLITVSVDGGKGLEFFRGDRDRFAVTGARHRIRIEFSDGSPPFERLLSFLPRLRPCVQTGYFPVSFHGTDRHPVTPWICFPASFPGRGGCLRT